MVQEGASSLNIIVKGAGIFFLGTIISKIVFFFFRVFVARYFGPLDYGLFTLSLAVIGFSSVFAIMGLNVGVTRYISHNRALGKKSKVKGTIKSSLLLSFVASTVVAILLIIFAETISNNIFNEPALSLIIRVMAVAIPFSSLTSIFSASFEGFKKIKYSVYTERIFLNVSKLSIVIVAGTLSLGVFGIAISYTIATILTFFLAFYFLEKRVYPILKTKVKSKWMGKELLIFSIPLLFAGFMSTIMSWTDTIMLGYFEGAIAVGIYNVAHPTAFLLFMAPAALATLFLPVITELHATRKGKELEIVYKTVTKWIVYFNLPLVLIMTIFSRQIINVVFGSEYIMGYMALSALSIGFFLYNLNQTSYHVLTMLKRTKLIFYMTAVCGVMNIILNYIFIPAFGIFGAAVASATSYVIFGCLLAIISRGITKMLPFSSAMLKSLFAATVATITIYLMAKTLFLDFSIYILALVLVGFILLYVILLLLFGGVEKEDVEILRAIERKSGIRNEKVRNFIKRLVKQ